MRHITICRLSVSFVLMACVVPAAGLTDIKLDFGIEGSPVQSGWVGVHNSNRLDNGTGVNLGDGVVAGVVAWNVAASRDRGAGTGGDPANDDLLRDFMESNLANGESWLEVRGLATGAYAVTLFVGDPEYPSTDEHIMVNGVDLDMPEWPGAAGTFPDDWAASIQVTIAAGEAIWLAQPTVGFGKIAGMTIADGEPDTTPPDPIADLSIISTGSATVTLAWTAPADQPGPGPAATYDIRYSTSPLDEGNWASVTHAEGEPTPELPGTPQSFTVTGLAPETTYYLAIKSVDAADNVSALSNVVSGTTQPPDTTPPAAVTDLAVSNVKSSHVTLNWTATGDDGTTGQATAYDVRYATSPIVNDSDFAAAMEAASEPTPQPAGASESFVVTGLSPLTDYWFALNVLDDGEPPNASGLSNVASATTPEQTNIAYGISNGFSLSATPSGGPYDPAVPATGDINITSINVDRTQITRRVDGGGPVYEGTIAYDIACSATDIFVWLELSTDGGATWNQRLIHGIGHVGPTSPGTGLSADWLVDGDHGDDCKIRIRVNTEPATCSNFDADNNKFPRPALWDDYPTLERMVSADDGFDFTHPDADLPHVDFFKQIAAVGQVKAGFAQVGYPKDTGVPDSTYFLQCAYFESVDGQHRFVVMQGDVLKIFTGVIHGWREQIESTFGIPRDHIMIFHTHVHNYLGSDTTFPTGLLQTAINNAEPVEVAWVNHRMNNSYNIHRCVMTDATHAHSSFSNSVYDTGNNPPLPVHIDYDPNGAIVDAWVEATPVSTIQTTFDSPCDVYLQMLVFRDLAQNLIKGVVLKWTGHPVNRDYLGDLTQAVRDEFRSRFGSQLQLFYGCGFGGNHRQLFAQVYPDEFGSERTAAAFADVLEAALPDLPFRPLRKLGGVMGYDTFGRWYDPEYSLFYKMIGSDPNRYGTGVQVLRFNDFYLSGLPNEAPSEQGFYIRSRTADTKHVYNAYCNTYYDYYSWGRWFDIGHYEHESSPPRYESWRMAEEIVRGVNILEQALPPTAKLVSSEPAADGTLAKTQNNVIRLVFDLPIALDGGPALSVIPIGGGTDVGGSFAYTIEPDGVTLRAVETGTVLSNQTWYRITPDASLDVEAFALDLCALTGDANGSSRITTADYAEVKAHMAEYTDARYDLNGNGRVTTADYSVVKAHMGQRTPTKP